MKGMGGGYQIQISITKQTVQLRAISSDGPYLDALTLSGQDSTVPKVTDGEGMLGYELFAAHLVTEPNR